MFKSDKDLIILGKTIRELREKKNLSQEDLCVKANVDRTYISDIERGERNFGIKFLIKLSKALEVKPSQILKSIE